MVTRLSGGGPDIQVTLFSPGKPTGQVLASYCLQFSLFRLARKYLSVQATSTPAERVMSAMGIILEKKRQRMTGDLFNEIMFMSDIF